MVYVITIGLAVLAVLKTYVAEVTLLFTIGLALQAAVKKYVTVTCSAEVVIQLFSIHDRASALCMGSHTECHGRPLPPQDRASSIGARAMGAEGLFDFSPQDARHVPGHGLGVVERELERTGSMVHGLKEVRSPNWNFRSCLRTPVRCNLGTGFILARQ